MKTSKKPRVIIPDKSSVGVSSLSKLPDFPQLPNDDDETNEITCDKEIESNLDAESEKNGNYTLNQFSSSCQ